MTTMRPISEKFLAPNELSVIFGFPKNVVPGRLRLGWSLRDAVTTPLLSRKIHGHSPHGVQSPTYVSWRNMIQRCINPQMVGYERYGGRGISVCDRWRNFVNFLADMGPRPEKTSIDRFPDNDGNYEPGNCRWATNREQGLNKTHPGARAIAAFGRTQTLTQWSNETGIGLCTLFYRLKKGTDPEVALLQPVDTRKTGRKRKS